MLCLANTLAQVNVKRIYVVLSEDNKRGLHSYRLVLKHILLRTQAYLISRPTARLGNPVSGGRCFLPVVLHLAYRSFRALTRVVWTCLSYHTVFGCFPPLDEFAGFSDGTVHRLHLYTVPDRQSP